MLIPPFAAHSPSIFPSLATEDEKRGGNGGGLARIGKNDPLPYVNELLLTVMESHFDSFKCVFCLLPLSLTFPYVSV